MGVRRILISWGFYLDFLSYIDSNTMLWENRSQVWTQVLIFKVSICMVVGFCWLLCKFEIFWLCKSYRLIVCVAKFDFTTPICIVIVKAIVQSLKFTILIYKCFPLCSSSVNCFSFKRIFTVLLTTNNGLGSSISFFVYFFRFLLLLN